MWLPATLFTLSDQEPHLTQTIPLLLVEDDPLILEMLTETLQESGFTIEAATTAEEAIRMLDAEEIKFSALITDVNLPGELTGWNVAGRAREIDEELPVIYITGGAAHDWASNGVPKSILLVKPFATAQVITAVSQLVNAASGTIG
jgi:DNA-binding response OmpR family regulator